MKTKRKGNDSVSKIHAAPEEVTIHDPLLCSYDACPGAHGQTTDWVCEVEDCDRRQH